MSVTLRFQHHEGGAVEILAVNKSVKQRENDVPLIQHGYTWEGATYEFTNLRTLFSTAIWLVNSKHGGWVEFIEDDGTLLYRHPGLKERRSASTDAPRPTVRNSASVKRAFER